MPDRDSNTADSLGDDGPAPGLNGKRTRPPPPKPRSLDPDYRQAEATHRSTPTESPEAQRGFCTLSEPDTEDEKTDFPALSRAPTAARGKVRSTGEGQSARESSICEKQYQGEEAASGSGGDESKGDDVDYTRRWRSLRRETSDTRAASTTGAEDRASWLKEVIQRRHQVRRRPRSTGVDRKETRRPMPDS